MKNAVMIALLSYSIDSQLPQDLPKAVSSKACIHKQLVEYRNHQLYCGLTESKSFSEQAVIADNYLHQNDQSFNVISITSNNEHNEDVEEDQIIQKKKIFRQKQLNDRYKFKNLQRKHTKPCIPSHR